MKEYFEEIEILEWVILKIEEKETLIQRDWSSFFDIQKDNKLYDIKEDNKDYKDFLEKLFLKLNNKFKSIQEYFEIDEKHKYGPLNERVYIFDNSKKDDLENFIINFYNNYLQEKYIKTEDKFDIDSICKKIFPLQKHFNPKAFFSDHESLLDKENDFLQNKKVFLWLKDDKKEKLNSLEDQINKLINQKFYVKVNLEDLKDIKIWWKNITFNWKQKYENIFILERWDYIYHTKKKENG